MGKPSFRSGDGGLDVGRRDGGRGGFCSRRGLVQRGCTPHFSFVVPKEKRAVHGPKRKALARSGAVALRAHGGRRIGACSDFAWPSGTLGSSASLQLPSRGGWCRPRRGGRRIDLLLFSLPLAIPCGSWCDGRMRASAPTEKKGAQPIHRGRCPHRPAGTGTHNRPGSA